MNLTTIRQDFEQDVSREYFNTGLHGFPVRSVWEKTLDFGDAILNRRQAGIHPQEVDRLSGALEEDCR